MRLRVEHVTRYHYDRPVRAVVQSHRMTPAAFEGQQVLDWQVEVSGGQPGGAFCDGAGDWITAWTVQGPVQEISVSVIGTVETTDMAGVLRGHKERLPRQVWLRETDATAPDMALRALAAQASGAEPLVLAHDLARLVAEAIAYRPGITHAHTTAAESLALGEGVCQDHAHALTAMARLRGMPARYVSGYLFASEDGTPHEAAHAWAEVWVEGLGWVGFDPANRCCPDARYIRLGCGLDARDAAPIRGIARGAGQESLDVSLSIEQSQQ
jgi:transglutaminase-like putative cysteine protease